MPGTAPDTDHELLQRWCGGSVAAGDRLFRRHEPGLRRLFGTKAWPQDVGDLVQRTWEGLLETLRRPARNTEGEELACGGGTIHTSVRAYLYGIARYVLLGYLRQKYSEQRFDPDVDSIDIIAPSLSRQLSLRRHVARLEIAFRSLPVELQLLAEAYYVDELSGSELAKMFAVPEGTIHSRLHRTRRLLVDALARLDNGRTNSTNEY